MTPGAPDIARLVEIITAEVMATLGHGGGTGAELVKAVAAVPKP